MYPPVLRDIREPMDKAPYGAYVHEGFFKPMKFILGTKQHMTQFFAADGKAYPATVVSATPNMVTQKKAAEKDGYVAAQVSFGTAKRVNKPLAGHFGERGLFQHVREFRLKDSEEVADVGTKIDVSVFAPGDIVRVSGTSKGKGFQGVVKRHGFHGGRRTHGQKHSEREPGSIGGGGRAGGRVVKGMRMAGRMGQDRVTVKNLKILAVDKENSQLLISGAVPGRRGTLLEIVSI